MKFNIQSNALIKGKDSIIQLPQEILEELGILEGQFLQIKGKEELVLQVTKNLDSQCKVALMSPFNFEKISESDVEFKTLDVTLGCDPEFFILWRQALISAASYLPFQGQIGCDGQLGELRPSYALHENEVASNIGKLIPNIPSSMRRAEWATSLPENGNVFRYEAHSYHQGLTAGFHVHLGIPPEILNTRKEFNRVAMNHLVQCLDWYVSVPLIPLEADHTRRLGNTSYGRPGDYRPSNITLEYRTPGAFYLRTPTLTKGMLGLCLLVTENIVSRMKSMSNGFVNLNKLTKTDLNEMLPIPNPAQIQETLLDRNPQTARNKIEEIRTQLQTLPTYAKHRQGLEEFFRIVEIGKRPEADLLNNWKAME